MRKAEKLSRQISAMDIETLYLLNERMKNLKKELEEIKDKIKIYMIQNEINALDTDEYSVSITTAKSKSVLEDDLANYLIKKGYEEAVRTKIIPDMDIVSNLLAREEIDSDYYNDNFIEVKEIKKLNVKKL